MTSLGSSAPFEVRSVIALRCILQASCHVNFRGPSSFSFSFLHLSAEVTELHCCAMSNFIWVLEIWTEVLKLVWKAFYSLSHLLIPPKDWNPIWGMASCSHDIGMSDICMPGWQVKTGRLCVSISRQNSFLEETPVFVLKAFTRWGKSHLLNEANSALFNVFLESELPLETFLQIYQD